MSAECKNLRDASSVGPECSCHTGVCVLGIERGATMTTDHASVIRACLRSGTTINNVYHDAFAALAALEAERDEALAKIDRLTARGIEDLTFSLEAAEADRDEARRELEELRLSAPSWWAASVTAERDTLAAALRDFADHGTRFDLNPTVVVHHTPEWVASQEWWQNRAVEMDTAVRNRARAALARLEGNPE